MQQQKVEKLRKTLKEKNLDGFLVSNFYNILYLSGFKTLVDDEREAWMLITAKNSYLFSDSRYLNVKSQNSNLKSTSQILKLITPEKGLVKHLQEIIVEEKIKKLGFEGEDLKYGEFLKFKEQLETIKIVPTDRLIIYQRAIKNEEEINKIKRACQVSDQCLTEIIKTVRAGTSEKEIAFKIEFWLKEKDYNEISDILKKPVGTVGTLVNRAKKKFRDIHEKIEKDAEKKKQ